MVTAVSWGRRRVVGRTSAGEELAAPQLIVTVPLGVLKAGAVEFSPRLGDKEEIIGRLEMGDAERVSLCLGSDAWVASGHFPPGGFLMTGEPPFPVWWVSRPPPFPVVTAWAGGRNARALAQLGGAARVDAAVAALAAALGVDAGRLRQDLRGGFSHDWLADPFARGAYSYAGVGGSDAGTSSPFRSTGPSSSRARRPSPTARTGPSTAPSPAATGRRNRCSVERHSAADLRTERSLERPTPPADFPESGRVRAYTDRPMDGQRPVKVGLRFARSADIPSRASSIVKLVA